MGIASLIIGIVCLLISLIPLFGAVVFTPTVVGLALGIVHVSKKEKGKKGSGIAGIVLCSISLLLIIGYYIVFGIFVVTEDFSDISIFKNISKQTMLKVGDSYDDDGLVLTYTSLNDNYLDYIGERKVQPGNKLIKVGIEAKNTSESTKYVNSYDFYCYADDYVCSNVYLETEIGLDGNLSKNKKIQGYLFFEVPENANSITIEHATYGLLPISNKVIFVVK